MITRLGHVYDITRMSHASTGIRARGNHLTNIRQRKSEKKLYEKEMVGLGSDEIFRSNISDIIREAEMKSDEEMDSDGDHTQRLIPSPIDNQCASSDDTKQLVNRTCQSKEFEDENVWSISVQMFVPFLLAGFGMVAASLLLDVVQVCTTTRFILYSLLPKTMKHLNASHG